jgi:hypothetical protein
VKRWCFEMRHAALGSALRRRASAVGHRADAVLHAPIATPVVVGHLGVARRTVRGYSGLRCATAAHRRTAKASYTNRASNYGAEWGAVVTNNDVRFDLESAAGDTTFKVGRQGSLFRCADIHAEGPTRALTTGGGKK